MNTITTDRFTPPQPLLSVPARIAAAVAVAAAIALAMLGAGQASEEAVQNAAHAFSPTQTYVKLSPVEIVGRRDVGEAKRT